MNFKDILEKIDTLNEASKPDFLDLDKDGNKKEPMKKAAKDKKVKEAYNPNSSAAQHARELKKHTHDTLKAKAEPKRATAARCLSIWIFLYFKADGCI